MLKLYIPGDPNGEVSICVATFGDEDKWDPLARRAVRSAEDQSIPARQIIWCYAPTLHEARNEAAEFARGEWLVFLDADDTLDAHYVNGILAGAGDLRQPSTLGVDERTGEEDPCSVLIPAKRSLLEGNWMVIGTGCRRELFEEVGGFGDEPLYEDYALWCKMVADAGAKIGTAPEAIYRVTVHAEGGRNLPERKAQEFWFAEIAGRYKGRL